MPYKFINWYQILIPLRLNYLGRILKAIMGDMSYRELSNWLAESKEALRELRVKYKASLAKRRELAKQLYEISENSSFEEANIDSLANEVENMNDDKSNLRRGL